MGNKLTLMIDTREFLWEDLILEKETRIQLREKRVFVKMPPFFGRIPQDALVFRLFGTMPFNPLEWEQKTVSPKPLNSPSPTTCAPPLNYICWESFPQCYLRMGPRRRVHWRALCHTRRQVSQRSACWTAPGPWFFAVFLRL
jgi:hypothetical protein